MFFLWVACGVAGFIYAGANMDFSEGGATCSCSVPFVHALCSSQYLWIGHLVACALSHTGGTQSLRSPQLVIYHLHLSHVQMSL